MNENTAIGFEDSARHHYSEMNLDDDKVRRMVTEDIVWYALLDPKDPTVPVVRHRRPVLFLVCRLPPDALNDSLAEVLVGMDGYRTVVFHVERLTRLWESYWRHHDSDADRKIEESH